MAHEILVIDDEADIRMLMCGILNDEGYETREAGTSTEALGGDALAPADLVILDIWLQGSELDGLEILKIIRHELPNLPVVMISGHGNIETAVAAIKIGAYDFIEKPFKSDRLLLVVRARDRGRAPPPRERGAALARRRRRGSDRRLARHQPAARPDRPRRADRKPRPHHRRGRASARKSRRGSSISARAAPRARSWS